MEHIKSIITIVEPVDPKHGRIILWPCFLMQSCIKGSNKPMQAHVSESHSICNNGNTSQQKTAFKMIIVRCRLDNDSKFKKN